MSIDYTGYLNCTKKIALGFKRGAGDYFNAVLSYETNSGTSLQENPETGNLEPVATHVTVEIRCKLYEVQAPASVRYNYLQGSNQNRIYMEGRLVFPLEASIPYSRQHQGMDAIVNGISGRFYPLPDLKNAEHYAINSDKATGQDISGIFEVLNI